MDAALPEAEVWRVIDAVIGTEAVLVAGQAVSVWAAFYQDRIPELGHVGGVYVSRDMDFYGDRKMAATCAEHLQGELRTTTAGDAFGGAAINSAVVTFRGEAGTEHRVDFLANVHGLRNSSKIRERAVPMESEAGTFWIIDPISQLRSRVANLTSLRRGQPAAKRQACIAVWVLREWLEDVLRDFGSRDALRAIERVFELATTREADQAAVLDGVEVFDAIRPLPGLPTAFQTIRYPQMKREVQRRRKRIKILRGGRAEDDAS